MHQAASISELEQTLQQWKQQRQSIAFIPTMGNLHRGHLALIEKGQLLCERTVCSIFVNPMQFGPNEDFNHYPRTLNQDLEQLEAAGCDLVYLPTAPELYPDGLENITQVCVTNLSETFEGAHRPGHFSGVATIVLKLFNIVKPDISVFGKKDFQQYRVIKKMTQDLHLGVKITGHETVRESTGLATSSRNQYLNHKQTEQAALIYKTLLECTAKIKDGDKNFHQLEKTAIQQLTGAGFTVEYFCVCGAQKLKPATDEDKKLVILVTACLGNTRLLDNIEINLR